MPTPMRSSAEVVDTGDLRGRVMVSSRGLYGSEMRPALSEAAPGGWGSVFGPRREGLETEVRRRTPSHPAPPDRAQVFLLIRIRRVVGSVSLLRGSRAR